MREGSWKGLEREERESEVVLSQLKAYSQKGTQSKTDILLRVNMKLR